MNLTPPNSVNLRCPLCTAFVAVLSNNKLARHKNNNPKRRLEDADEKGFCFGPKRCDVSAQAEAQRRKSVRSAAAMKLPRLLRDREKARDECNRLDAEVKALEALFVDPDPAPAQSEEPSR